MAVKQHLETQAAFARRQGLSRQTVSRLVKTGVILTHRGRINPEEAIEAIAAKSPPSIATMSYSVAKTRHEQFRAALAELDFKARSGEVIPVEVVQKSAFETGRRVREAMQNIAPRIESIIAAETDVARVRAILDNEITAALSNLADEFSAPKQKGA